MPKGEYLPALDREALTRLRDTARRIGQSRRSALPVSELLDLAAAAGMRAGITIDFEASQELGDALIVLRIPSPPPASDPRLGTLSAREREIAELVSRGLSNKQLAQRLGISLATVKDHVHHILQKTALPNRAAVAAAWKGPLNGC